MEEGYQKGLFICSGRREPRTGGVILVNLEKEEEVKQVVSKDPFYVYGIADYTFIKFIPTMYAEPLSSVIK